MTETENLANSAYRGIVCDSALGPLCQDPEPNPNIVEKAMGMTLNNRVVSCRVFYHGGLDVEERICNWDDPTKLKLMWCLHPFEQTVINDKPNPICHIDFEKGNEEELAAAREKVEAEFNKYHNV